MTCTPLSDVLSFLASPGKIASYEWLDAQGRHADVRVTGGMLRLVKRGPRAAYIVRISDEQLAAVADRLPPTISWPGKAAA